MTGGADDFQERKHLLESAIRPRPARYVITSQDGRETGVLPWGIAMASAMKSLRNGAQVVDMGAGTVKLVNGDDYAVWSPK